MEEKPIIEVSLHLPPAMFGARFERFCLVYLPTILLTTISHRKYVICRDLFNGEEQPDIIIKMIQPDEQVSMRAFKLHLLFDFLHIVL
jgi:hypothetical protein